MKDYTQNHQREENAPNFQHIRIVGSGASLEWNDSTADRLIFEEQGKPQQVLTRGMDYLDDLAREDERLR